MNGGQITQHMWGQRFLTEGDWFRARMRPNPQSRCCGTSNSYATGLNGDMPTSRACKSSKASRTHSTCHPGNEKNVPLWDNSLSLFPEVMGQQWCEAVVFDPYYMCFCKLTEGLGNTTSLRYSVETVAATEHSESEEGIASRSSGTDVAERRASSNALPARNEMNKVAKQVIHATPGELQ